MANKQKLELTWIGKENPPKLEPRSLLADLPGALWRRGSKPSTLGRIISHERARRLLPAGGKPAECPAGAGATGPRFW